VKNFRHMSSPRPTRLRSQRDINLWRIPLRLSLAAVALFGITLVPDILDKYGLIHIPSWLTMGSIDDARAIPVGDDGRGRNRARADFLGSTAGAVDGCDALKRLVIGALIATSIDLLRLKLS
jgi:hypothetical protein